MFIESLRDNPSYYVAVIIAIVVSICLHELAHGLVAIRFGDRTPIEQGRITLNPLVHMGPTSLLVLVLAGIAWGAMPIDRTRLRGRYAEAAVAAAGPATNFLLALVTLGALGLWIRFDTRSPDDIGQFTENGRYLLLIFGFSNFTLALFNLIPVPPLDGSHILGNFSRSYARLMESLQMGGGMLIVFLIVFVVAGRFILPAADWLTQKYLTFLLKF